VTVTRDTVATNPVVKARKHANGSTVYTGVRSRFYSYDVTGLCTRTQEAYLPHIATVQGIVSDCRMRQPATWVNLPEPAHGEIDVVQLGQRVRYHHR
jgi:hypothetical protein